ncbi:methyl-accepting chemotaxis protein [Desulfohalovibrio reitneri]|uniref:methyl-accepting chemotaxis protein n=1 Tax=Desulfohalovibrio reitneri TaxID=1307759 RepID=UPI00068E1ADB|nr:methyl-accepting chemotaxis protein [Desulfohalovibrio reitneri]
MKSRLSFKVLLLVAASLAVLAGVVIFTLTANLNRFAESQVQEDADFIFSRAREKLSDQVQLAYSLVEEFHRRAQAGEMSEDQAKQAALDMIAAMRLEDGNYLWVNDMHPRMIMHPIKPSLDGQDLSGFEDPEGKKLFVEMVEAVRDGGSGFVEYMWPKPDQEKNFSKLSHVKRFQPWGWVVGMGAYVDELEGVVASKRTAFRDKLSELSHQTAMEAGLIGLVVLAAIFLALRRMLTSPLSRLVEYAGRVSKGDLEAEPRGAFKDEMLVLMESIRSMVGKLRESLHEAEEEKHKADAEAERAVSCMNDAEAARSEAEQARKDGMAKAADLMEEAVDQLSRETSDLSRLAAEAARGASRQSDRSKETATAMEEMNATVLEVARNASQAAENSEKTRVKADEGRDVVEEAMEAISTVQNQTRELAGHMERLGERAEGIGRIITVIEDIADQTNLLALNAAIEAARAGDAGRGFAVVADEVRKLAEKTMGATKEVSEAIQGIQEVTRTSLDVTEQAGRSVERSTEQARNSGDALREIVAYAEETASQVSSIATASEEQSAASEEINQATEEVDRISGETAQSMARAEEVAGRLSELSGRLSQAVERLRQEP